jgi:hypothetical protein
MQHCGAAGPGHDERLDSPRVANWWIKADLLESCNCQVASCPCNYTTIPTHGYCEAVLTWWISEGAFGETKLGDLGFGLILAWPNAIHEGNGRALVYPAARADDAQREALAKIGGGEAGEGGPFETFATTYSEPASVAHGPLQLKRDGKRARVTLGALGLVAFEPILSAMDGSEADLRWVKRSGFLWRDGDIVQTAAAEATADALSFRYEGSWGVFSQIAYNAKWPDPVIRSYED